MRLSNKLFTWIPAIIMMIIIFRFSSASGNQSAGLSLQLTRNIVNMVENVANLNLDSELVLSVIDRLHTLLRKMGHVTEYAILAITVAFPLYVHHKRRWNLALRCVSICIIYACSDEFHQLFVAERSGQITDIFIDSIGVILGILFFNVITILYKRIKYRLNSSVSVKY